MVMMWEQEQDFAELVCPFSHVCHPRFFLPVLTVVELKNSSVHETRVKYIDISQTIGYSVF